MQSVLTLLLDDSQEHLASTKLAPQNPTDSVFGEWAKPAATLKNKAN